MTWIFALIDRLLLLGFASSFVFGLYLLIRNWLKHQISGWIRRFAWMVVLLLPVLAIPWPNVVHVPANTPAWIHTGRLPDLTVPYPADSPGLLVAQTDQTRLQDTAKTGTPDAETAEQSISTTSQDMLPDGAFPWLWYLRHQKLIRSLWLASTVLYVLIRLLQAHRGRRGQGRGLPAVALTAVDWLQDLARARDAIGLYRRGPLLRLTGEPTFFQSLQFARRQAILLPEDSDQISDEKQRQTLLQQAIIQQKHPDILMSLLYCFEHIWLWFWPAGWNSSHIYLEDRQIWQKERLSRRLAQKTARRPGTARPVTASMLVFLFFALPILALWQNPLYLWPDMDGAIKDQAAILAQVSQLNLQHDGVSDTYFLWSSYYGELTGPGRITSYSDGIESGIQLLDQTGQPAWRLRLDERLADIWPHPEPDQTNSSSRISLLSQQEFENGNYLLTAQILHMSIEPQTVLLQVAQDGEWLGYALIGDIVSAATGEASEYWVDRAYQTVMMRDGDLVIFQYGISSLVSAAGQPEHNFDNYLFRIRDGAVLWKFSLDDLRAAGLNLFVYQDDSMIWQRSIQQCFPANDGGLFLVISDAVTLRNDKAVPVYTSMLPYTTYPLTNQIARLKPDGTLDWIVPVGDHERPVTILDAEHADNGKLYLAAQVQYRQPVLHQSKTRNYFSSYYSPYNSSYDHAYASGAIIVLDGDEGRETWRQDNYAKPWSLAAQVLLQDETVTVLYQHDPYGNRLGRLDGTDEVPSGLSCETICQYDLDGRLTGYVILPKAAGPLNWDYIFIRPGDVILPTSKQAQG